MPRKKKSATIDKGTLGADSASESNDELHCICQKPDDHSFMIGCDQCEGWFHGKCVNMTKAKAKKAPHWICPNCEDLKKKDTLENGAYTLNSDFSDPSYIISLDNVDIINSEMSGTSSPNPSPSSPDGKNSSSVSPSKRRAMENDNSESTNKSISVIGNSIKKAKLDLVLQNPIRKRVIDTMQKVLKSALSLAEQKGLKTFDIMLLSEQIEFAMFDALAIKGKTGVDACGDDYKQKFRMLHFNLKTPQNAVRVLSGELTPSTLIGMRSEDFADEELKKERQKIKEESLRDSILTPQQANVILKKTRKGEEVVNREPIDQEGDSDISPNDDTVASTSASGAVPQKSENSSSDLNSVESLNEAKDAMKSSDVGADISDAVPGATSPITPRHSSAFVDELLSKVDPAPASKENDNNVEEQKVSDEEKANVRDSVPEKVRAPRPRPDPKWYGVINFDLAGSFEGACIQAGGKTRSSREWYELVPGKVNIDGRIPPQSVEPYVSEQLISETHEVMIAELYPAEEAEEDNFNKIFEYFHSRGRYAVIPKTTPRVKDFYLIPLEMEDALPEFLATADHDVETDRERRAFLCIIVISPDYGQKISTSGPEASSFPAATSQHQLAPESAVIDPNISHALSLLNSIVPNINDQSLAAPVIGQNQGVPGAPMGQYPNIFPGYGVGSLPQSQSSQQVKPHHHHHPSRMLRQGSNFNERNEGHKNPRRDRRGNSRGRRGPRRPNPNRR